MWLAKDKTFDLDFDLDKKKIKNRDQKMRLDLEKVLAIEKLWPIKSAIEIMKSHTKILKIGTLKKEKIHLDLLKILLLS